MAIIEKTFQVNFSDFNFLEYHLRNEVEFDGMKDAVRVESFWIPLKENYNLALDIINAKTDAGGAYVDPIIFKELNGYNSEVQVCYVNDTLTSIEFEFEGDTYIVRAEIVPDERVSALDNN